ncbi:MAG: type II CRISPR RNA-guided endonuclease Cas9 [Hornefia sp.]|nr:type II CRISPR RNA-guided endonuclease Cas9 [Hornefia sp.]
MKKEYYLGLDIGTNSVGWAVTDLNYNLCKFRKKDMWGIRLFDEANTAEDRRLKRAGRRRLARRRDRILLLQSLFAEEINKIDDTFFIRLNESKLWMEDKTVKSKHPLFMGKDYTDIEYYKDYPTIFHLRKELISNAAPHDSRLVYLAFHNIVKHRGHFLISGDLQGAKDFKQTFMQMKDLVENELQINLDIDENGIAEFESVLKDKMRARSIREKDLIALFDIATPERTKEEQKVLKTQIQQICKYVLGLKGDITKLFCIDKDSVTKNSFSFADSNYEDETRTTLDDEIPEQVYLIDSIKTLYDWSILEDILKDEQYFSYAKVNQYQKHKENLGKLRGIILKYCDKDVYNNMFNDTDEKVKNSYSNYIGFVKKNGKKYSVKMANSEDFYKNLLKVLETITPDQGDEALLHELKMETKAFSLLPLQRDKNNSVVPYQVHEAELKQILDNASKYLEFLKKEDENGLTVSDKIQAVFKFRVPYYVGPLSTRHKDEGANVWIKRKEGMENERIYPWNYKDVIDMEKSNEEFINRMTNKCTYLFKEDVLPKNSLLYTKYMVLNELNNLKIYNREVEVKTKQNIYNELFLNKARVTGKALLEYLKRELPELKKENLSGFDENFNTSLKSYLDFQKQVFNGEFSELKYGKAVEDIIKWITIYGEDKKMLVRVIEQNYPGYFSKEQLKKIKGLRFSGWGNFSYKFLKGIVGCNKETGELGTIMDFMWETNDNLMQILSGRYTFAEQIDEINMAESKEIKSVTFENTVEDLYVSPANKRAVWQTIQIAEEVKKVMGCAPKKIFIEMARGGGKKKHREKSRKEQLKLLYNECEKDVRDYWLSEIEKHDERDFNSMKLYLYYTQLGKCMYTGESIALGSLMQGNSKWDRDHIYPQSKIKDDSIDNLVLVNKDVNSKKTNQPIAPEIQAKMGAYWLSLLNRGFISKKKYDRLTKKGEFTTEELSGFINRQLVETRQSTKAVADVFKKIYRDSKIVYVKASIASDFRKKPLRCLKSRRVNDFHHAKDAYLNIVVGNVYNTKFTSNPSRWIKENRDTNYSLNAIFNYDVSRNGELAWKAPDKDENNKFIPGTGTIKTVRKVMKQNNPLYTEYVYCWKGELFNATVQPKEKETSIPLKKGLDTGKYGGYHSAKTSYFAFIEFDGKKGERIRNIMGVPVYVANQISHNPIAFEEYCRDVKGLTNVKVLVDKIKKNSLIRVNGFPMRVVGETVGQVLLKCNMQLIVPERIEENIRRIEKYLDKKADFEVVENFDKINDESMDITYDYLLNKIQTVYSKRPANQGGFLGEKKEKFNSLSVKEKAQVINEILNHVRCDNYTQSNLSLIGGGKNAGNIAINKNTLGKSELVLINQSVTGLFENRIEL